MTRITELKPGDRAQLDDPGQPRHAHGVDGDRNRIGHVELLVIDDARQHDCPQAVENRADDERADDADRHVALGVLGLLGGRGDGVEADVSEEDQASPAEDAAPAVIRTIPTFRGMNLPPQFAERDHVAEPTTMNDDDDRRP